MDDATITDPGTALVLGGGGGRGAAQLGVLRALAERGFQPDMCVGTSVGALNASVVAGRPLGEAVTLLEKVWASPETQDVFRSQVLRMAVNRVRRRPWLRSGECLHRLVHSAEALTGHHTFEELMLPLHIVLTDLAGGEPKVVSSGPLERALCASCAVPGVFPPELIDGRHYVDGGVIDNCSLATAAALQPRRIVAIDLSADDLPTQPRRIGEVFQRVMSVALHARVRADFDRFSGRFPVTLICPRPVSMRGLRFADFGAIRERAFDATDRLLQRIALGDGAFQPGLFYLPVPVEF